MFLEITSLQYCAGCSHVRKLGTAWEGSSIGENTAREARTPYMQPLFSEPHTGWPVLCRASRAVTPCLRDGNFGCTAIPTASTKCTWGSTGNRPYVIEKPRRNTVGIDRVSINPYRLPASATS